MEILIAGVYIAFIVFLFALLIFFVLYLTAALVSAISNVPFVGSSRRKIRSILAYAKPQEGKVFIDLGSGDGRVVFEAAKTFKLKATGVEFNPLLTAFSRIMAKLTKIESVSFITGDALETKLNKAHIIYIFLLPHLLDKLADKILAECKPGTLIISHGFKIEKLKKHLTEKVEDTPFSTYYYTI